MIRLHKLVIIISVLLRLSLAAFKPQDVLEDLGYDDLAPKFEAMNNISKELAEYDAWNAIYAHVGRYVELNTSFIAIDGDLAAYSKEIEQLDPVSGDEDDQKVLDVAAYIVGVHHDIFIDYYNRSQTSWGGGKPAWLPYLGPFVIPVWTQHLETIEKYFYALQSYAPKVNSTLQMGLDKIIDVMNFTIIAYIPPPKTRSAEKQHEQVRLGVELVA